DKVAALKRKLDDTEAEKDRLIKEAELTQARLQRAEVLTVGLAGESVRWKETVEKMDVEIEALTGDVFLSAAAISYFGSFTGQYRREVVGEWLSNMQKLNIPCSETFSLVAVMGSPVQVREWNLQGLPSDSVSLDNGVLVTRGKRWPLMIDPQEQANKWIKKKEGAEGSSGQLQLLKLGNPKLLLIVENAIRMGDPLLIEDIGEALDPSLEPVLQKAVFNNNGRLQIHLGDSD
ncbi:dynein heavy chain, putative, partial [Perkinsus marinus ATCC 50983]